MRNVLQFITKFFDLNIAGHCLKMVRCTIILILGILALEILAIPLNLEVSIKRAQNGNITNRNSNWKCMVEGQFCLFHATLCCKPLQCKPFSSFLDLRCQKPGFQSPVKVNIQSLIFDVIDQSPFLGKVVQPDPTSTPESVSF